MIAVSADPALFTLVDDAVPVSGAQNFNELADVENAKWDPPYYEYTRYASAIKGHAAMVGDTEKIWPSAIEDPSFMFWAKATPQEIGSAWGVITNWVIQQPGSHEDATVIDRSDSHPDVDFEVTPGVYKVDFQYSVPSSNGLIGRTQFQVGAHNCFQWPGHTFHDKAKHFYFDNPGPTDPPPLQQTMVRWVSTEDDGPGVDEGPVFVVVPGNDALISIAMRQFRGFRFMCAPTIAVSRIN